MNMNIFLDLKNASVNVGKIKEIGIARKDAVRITFDDESSDVYSTYGDAESFMERFDRTVLQIVPCTVPMYNVYKNDDGTYFHERVEYLALCADGSVRSYASADLYLELAAEASNFVGYFCEENLKNFPTSKQ